MAVRAMILSRESSADSPSLEWSRKAYVIPTHIFRQYVISLLPDLDVGNSLPLQVGHVLPGIYRLFEGTRPFIS